ncbi:coiled-coil domain-containing protein 30 isoform X1 [Tachysurus vachellii]|uniref:coiled-coil domain-containing protein 30 isoform X1 n=1 Tax=Tachysurus vachellii TaxID=175792 RepID=UPI00296B12AA|nr:coiled-coil domain-containing protein 30 isoform X1 [Tachysurus vachellii]XP_060750248.1 coiled-coil domain-containing protein 30 isoform X1 [Tachysurus vachellii]
MEQKQEKNELKELSMRLEKDGISSQASLEERQIHMWRLLRSSECSLASATQELQTLREQQVSEMKEVESYVEHIRNMLEERECLTAEYERDNEQLRAELEQIKHQQECQYKEVTEMLEQEGLAEISNSSSSEQVAYLLVERVTLLERLEAAERKLDTQTLTGNLREVHLQEELDHIRHTLEEELRQQKEMMRLTKESMSKGNESAAQSTWRKLFGVHKATKMAQSLPLAHSVEQERERTERKKLERDLEEASCRLTMAHQEIRHLTDELDVARKGQHASGPDLHTSREEVTQLKQEVEQLKQFDMEELQKAKEHNKRLDAEIRALRDRVRSLDSERKTLLKMIENFKIHPSYGDKPATDLDSNQSVQVDGNVDHSERSGTPVNDEKDQFHRRCRRESEDKDCRLRELERRLQKQQQKHEELVERNEELEALLGEAQNKATDERQRHECEVDSLQRKIKNLEAELNAKSTLEKRPVEQGDQTKETISEVQGGIQERLTFLESRLAEEKDWRKRLEVDLALAQSSLRKEKQALQSEHTELKKLRIEVQSLQAERQQGKSLNVSLTVLKGEKGILEEKVAQLERARSRLQDELAQHIEGSRVQEELRESREQVTQLNALVEQLQSKLCKLEKEHSTLRNEIVEKRRQVMELQAELSVRAQERLQAEGQAERLGLELQLKKEQLQAAQQEGVCDPNPKSFTGNDNKLSQVACVKSEMSKLHTTLEQDRLLVSQHQLALQAQISEAQARVKAQDSVLQQKGEENKQLKQDLQRTQHLFTSAERELRYEREKNLDLKRHNALLDQEKIKLCAELKQAQSKLAQLEASATAQSAELEQLQQRARELDLELARNNQNRLSSSSLREELNTERARVLAADKKVLELQQQLKNALHQLRLEEARAGETSKLERDTRDMSDNLSALRAKLHEEKLQRKLVEKREEELQQQVRSLRTKEATISRVNSELSHRSQQMETKLEVLESELSSAKKQQSLSQKSCLKLEEQLMSSQQESERLQEELQNILQQLVANFRRNNERHSVDKAKLRRAKQLFMKATAQRDMKIQKLENDLGLAMSLSEKEKVWIRTVTEENEQLLMERRELLRRITEAEEMGNNGMRTATDMQQRVKFLELENKQLQDKTLKLANQIGVLERALRNLQSVCNAEEVKKLFPSDTLPDGLLQASSPKLGLRDSWGLLDAICRVKVGEHVKSLESSLSLPTSQPSEIGYLNVSSSMAPSVTQHQEENHSVSSEDA